MGMKSVKKIDKRKIYRAIWSIVRFTIIFGLAFIILKPIFIKVLRAFVSQADLMDPSVNFLPRHPSTYYWQQAISQMVLPTSFINSFILSTLVGIIQVISCTMVGYGLGRYNGWIQKISFAFVVVIMLVPYDAISTAQYLRFSFFGVGPLTVNLLDTYWPVVLLSFTGTNLKNGLYIYLMREFFRAMPKNLEEAAYIDGCGPIRSFVRVIMPNAKGMMTTVLIFSFCWQWTEKDYSRSYFIDIPLVGNIFSTIGTGTNMEVSIERNAAVILAMIPLIIIFLIFQRTLVKSITFSGMAN